MTAIVGVLNKHAVAIAADSAVTMGDTHKVVNSANKIFTLSKYNPVAVMTYNNASFMGVPWDIIIKEYRKQLKDVNFPTLYEYASDFVQYLHRRNFFCDEQTQAEFMIFALNAFLNICHREIKDETGTDVEVQTREQLEKKLSDCLSVNKVAEKCDGFESYSYDDFKNFAYAKIGNHVNGKDIDVDLLTESFFYYLSAKFSAPLPYTGLVFVGYGEDEIYPSLYPINISMAIDNNLKYYLDKPNIAVIKEHGPGAIIIPFAQIDVTQTIIRGINPTFQDIIYNVTEKSMVSFSKAITDMLDANPSTATISSAIKGLNLKSMIEDMTSQIKDEMLKTYTNPLLNTVVALDKEDMANMAESFISLTSLVRRMQPGEETVGGPVDVAVISKGDGFVWINRKHYFKPELNAPFFSNYFK